MKWSPKNVCRKFEVIPFKNVVLEHFKGKNGYFSWHLHCRYYHAVPHIYLFLLRFIWNKLCYKAIFRVLSEKLTHTHFRLRMRLWYVTGPNHVDSWAAYTFILVISRKKCIKWKCETCCVRPELWCHRWPRVQFFLSSSYRFCPRLSIAVWFFRHVYWNMAVYESLKFLSYVHFQDIDLKLSLNTFSFIYFIALLSINYLKVKTWKNSKKSVLDPNLNHTW